jgi:aminopeptidase N
MKVKAPFVPFAGGKTIRRVTEDGYNVLETQIDQPVHFIAVTAGKYSFEEEKRGNVTIRTASYGQKNTRAIKKINALAFDMIQYYEYFLGPYPGEELNILELNSFGSGQAPAGLVFITSEAFQPLLEPVNQLFSEGINERLAHEIAHQYWGVSVRWPSAEEQWLSESFAEYSAALLLKKFQGDAPYKRLIAHWKADANESHNIAPIPLANRITDEFNRTKLLYGKGPYLLAALNKQVGDEPFLIFLKSYQKSFKNKPGTTKDVMGLLGFMTKQDFKPFFDKYYWGTDVPEIK